MKDYISNEKFCELCTKIRLELQMYRRDVQKTNELEQKLIALKKIRKKSIILENTCSEKEKGL
jgi:hypothetical protein